MNRILTVLMVGGVLVSAGTGIARAESSGAASGSILDMSLEDILNQTITVASQKEETLAEAPVITTVITADEIKRMGARTLNEVLLTIPGFSLIQDHNEIYSGERGIYSSSQQKILVLRDGHRLNSRSYSEANFGANFDLDNVKRIEVMRGPGATLYGDVALTGVINIVTRDGKDINGGDVTVGAGDFGQKKISFSAGQDLGQGREISFFGWGYQSDGEVRNVGASRDYSPHPVDGQVILGRIQGATPAYDVGFKYRDNDLLLSVAHRYDHYTMPRGGGGSYGELIYPGDWRSFEGEDPGLSSEFGNYELKYTPKVFDDGVLTVRPYYDTFVFKDNEPQRRADETGANGVNPKSYFMEWLERSYGIENSILKPYSFLGKGDLLAGIQLEEMDIYDTWDIHSPDPTHADWYMPTTKVLKPGREDSYAAYAQVKHRLSSELILNLGLRYDYKTHLTVNDVDGFSPRAAVIYLPNDRLNLRLSYGKSFADGPYWYRYNQSGAGYTGSVALRPEWLETSQLTVEVNNLPKYFVNRVNFFLNRFNDVIYRNASQVYVNSGKISSDGIEYEIEYHRENADIRANYTYQYTYECAGYGYHDGMIANIPAHMGNIIADYAPWHSSGSAFLKNLWLNVNAHVVGQQYSPWGITGNFSGQDLSYMNPAYTVCNASVNFEKFIRDDMALRLHAYNLTDERYTQGGSVNLPYEEPGRWFLAEVSYKW